MIKSEFLDFNVDDLVVWMVLGEIYIIVEIKWVFSDEGVNVEVLEDVVLGKEIKVICSLIVILVKNLLFLIIEDELVFMFGVFGSIVRVIFFFIKMLVLVNFWFRVFFFCNLDSWIVCFFLEIMSFF